tara:strand:- start:7436 stop:7993 length:558 start_codon:yes stop_codon:yes gene_type:complete
MFTYRIFWGVYRILFGRVRLSCGCGLRKSYNRSTLICHIVAFYLASAGIMGTIFLSFFSLFAFESMHLECEPQNNSKLIMELELSAKAERIQAKLRTYYDASDIVYEGVSTSVNSRQDKELLKMTFALNGGEAKFLLLPHTKWNQGDVQSFHKVYSFNYLALNEISQGVGAFLCVPKGQLETAPF